MALIYIYGKVLDEISGQQQLSATGRRLSDIDKKPPCLPFFSFGLSTKFDASN